MRLGSIVTNRTSLKGEEKLVGCWTQGFSILWEWFSRGIYELNRNIMKYISRSDCGSFLLFPCIPRRLSTTLWIHTGHEVKDPSILDYDITMEMSGQLHAPSTLLQRKALRYLLKRRPVNSKSDLDLEAPAGNRTYVLQSAANYFTISGHIVEIILENRAEGDNH
jgi:hypothetical protein